MPRPMAGCQVAPPSTETSTPPTGRLPPPAMIGGGAADRDRRPAADFRAGERIGDRRGRRPGVGGLRRRHQTRLQRARLRAHVGQQVDGRLLHPRVGRRAAPRRGCRPGPRTTAWCRRRRPGPRWRRGRASGGGSPCRGRSWSRSRGVAGRRRWWSWRGRPGRRGGSRCRALRPTRSRACSPASVAVWPGGQRGDRSCCARSASCRPPPGPGSRAVPALTMKIVPVSAFSGRPPSAGGLKRGSRQVPVQVGGRVDLRVRVRLLVTDQGAVGRCPIRRCCSPSASSRRSRCR